MVARIQEQHRPMTALEGPTAKIDHSRQDNDPIARADVHRPAQDHAVTHSDFRPTQSRTTRSPGIPIANPRGTKTDQLRVSSRSPQTNTNTELPNNLNIQYSTTAEENLRVDRAVILEAIAQSQRSGKEVAYFSWDDHKRSQFLTGSQHYVDNQVLVMGDSEESAIADVVKQSFHVHLGTRPPSVEDFVDLMAQAKDEPHKKMTAFVVSNQFSINGSIQAFQYNVTFDGTNYHVGVEFVGLTPQQQTQFKTAIDKNIKSAVQIVNTHTKSQLEAKFHRVHSDPGTEDQRIDTDEILTGILRDYPKPPKEQTMSIMRIRADEILEILGPDYCDARVARRFPDTVDATIERIRQLNNTTDLIEHMDRTLRFLRHLQGDGFSISLGDRFQDDDDVGGDDYVLAGLPYDFPAFVDVYDAYWIRFQMLKAGATIREQMDVEYHIRAINRELIRIVVPRFDFSVPIFKDPVSVDAVVRILEHYETKIEEIERRGQYRDAGEIARYHALIDRIKRHVHEVEPYEDDSRIQAQLYQIKKEACDAKLKGIVRSHHNLREMYLRNPTPLLTRNTFYNPDNAEPGTLASMSTIASYDFRNYGDLSDALMSFRGAVSRGRFENSEKIAHTFIVYCFSLISLYQNFSLSFDETERGFQDLIDMALWLESEGHLTETHQEQILSILANLKEELFGIPNLIRECQIIWDRFKEAEYPVEEGSENEAKLKNYVSIYKNALHLVEQHIDELTPMQAIALYELRSQLAIMIFALEVHPQMREAITKFDELTDEIKIILRNVYISEETAYPIREKFRDVDSEIRNLKLRIQTDLNKNTMLTGLPPQVEDCLKKLNKLRELYESFVAKIRTL